MFVRLAAALGARRGEVCGLRWSDLDEAAATITIKRAVVDVAGRVHVKDTKTHAERTVTIDAGTLALLVAHHRAMSDRAEECGVVVALDAYVLSPEPDGAKPLRPERATNVFRGLRVKAGVPSARLHDLRHFVATQLIGAGHDIRTVSGPAASATPRPPRRSTSTPPSSVRRTGLPPRRSARCSKTGRTEDGPIRSFTSRRHSFSRR
jgi:integrase